MAKAKKLQSGSWRVRDFSHYEVVGGAKKPRYRSFSAETKAEAERMAAEFKAGKGRRDRGRLTVGEAVEDYIESKSAVLSPATLRAYRNTLSDKSKTFTEKANEYFSENLLPSATKKNA